jgi:O-antigen ligase
VSAHLIFALSFCIVLFADFIPSYAGSFADQRLFLSLLLVVLLTLGVFKVSRPQIKAAALNDVWPFFPFIFILSLPALEYSQGEFFLVEPVFYSLYVLAFGLTGFIVRAQGRSKETADALVLIAIIGCFFYAMITVMVYLFAVTDNFSQLDQMIPWGFVNIRYWSHIATWVVPLFPLALIVLPWSGNRLWRVGVTITAALWWWVLLLSSSRGSIIGLLAGAILVWIFFGRAALPWVKLFTRFLIYGLVAWLLLSVVIPGVVFESVEVRGIKGHSSGRLPLWLEAFSMSLQNFPFGMGPQSWLTHDVLTDAYQNSKKFAHPHNMYLMWAAEYGWIAIAALAFLCGVVLKRLWARIKVVRSGENECAPYLIALTASVTAAVVHGGVSAVFLAPGSMLIGLCVLSVFWAFVRPETAELNGKQLAFKSTYGRYSGLILTLAMASASSFWFCEVLKYRRAMADDLTYYGQEVSLGQLPRFWLHGYYPRPDGQMPDETLGVLTKPD